MCICAFAHNIRGRVFSVNGSSDSHGSLFDRGAVSIFGGSEVFFVMRGREGLCNIVKFIIVECFVDVRFYRRE